MFAFMLVDFLYSRILKLRYYKNIKELLCQNYIHSFIHSCYQKEEITFIQLERYPNMLLVGG